MRFTFHIYTNYFKNLHFCNLILLTKKPYNFRSFRAAYILMEKIVLIDSNDYETLYAFNSKQDVDELTQTTHTAEEQVNYTVTDVNQNNKKTLDIYRNVQRHMRSHTFHVDVVFLV